MSTKTSLGPADDDWNRHKNLFTDRRVTKPEFGYEKPGSRWMDANKNGIKNDPKGQFKQR
jgi:hypothetical protein